MYFQIARVRNKLFSHSQSKTVKLLQIVLEEKLTQSTYSLPKSACNGVLAIQHLFLKNSMSAPVRGSKNSSSTE